MSLKEQLSKMFLNRSNSYRFYKEYYDARNVTDSNKELKKLKKEFKKFKKENEQFKRNTNEYIDSCNYLFNNIYLDYTHKPTKTLQNIKILCAELLVFVNKVCEKHDIQWWLDYGTLLGAVRHEGFLPWVVMNLAVYLARAKSCGEHQHVVVTLESGLHHGREVAALLARLVNWDANGCQSGQIHQNVVHQITEIAVILATDNRAESHAVGSTERMIADERVKSSVILWW